MVSEELTQFTPCDECSRAMPKTKKIHQGKRYCATCYPRLFKRRMCGGCGNFARLPIFDLAARCTGCARDKPCVRCGRRDFKLGCMTPYGPACKSCVPYFREPEQCEVCGKVSRRLATNTQSGLRSCPTCSGPAAATCTACRRHRVLVQGESGSLLCRPCHELGNIDCGTCGQSMPAGKGRECDDCYWLRTFNARLTIDVAGFSTATMSKVFGDFGAWLLKETGPQPAALKIHRHFMFFSEMEKHWGQLATYEQLLESFGASGLRKAELPMRWLRAVGRVVVDEVAREHHTEMRRVADLLESVVEPNFKDILKRYHANLLVKVEQGGASVRSVRLALRPAVDLLHLAGSQGAAMPTQRTLEHFWHSSPGQLAAVTGFVNFLNRTFVLKLESRPDKRLMEKARRRKKEKALRLLISERQEGGAFERKWIAAALAYFHGISKVSSQRLTYVAADYKAVPGFNVTYGGDLLWVPSCDGFPSLGDGKEGPDESGHPDQ